MNDDQIIQLYFDRSEQAIKETDTKYAVATATALPTTF